MAAALPLAFFVAYHLVNPSKRSREVFWDYRFLTLAGVLGAACSFSYWATGGSLLAATVTHWVPVYIWVFFFGGFAKLQG
jgi:predicted Abi (CAAX) family protease